MADGDGPDGSSSNGELHPGLESVGGAAGTGAGVGAGAVEAEPADVDGLQVEMASANGHSGNHADAAPHVSVCDSSDDGDGQDGGVQLNAAMASVGEPEVEVPVDDARE